MNKYGLYCDSLRVTPEDCTWNNYSESWEIAIDMTDDEYENESFFPLMNYRYLLPNFTPDESDKEKMSCCTIVYDRESEEYYLALTGGGMDLSAEICQTYVNLGYYPPVHFSELPRMSGFGENESDKKLIAICNEGMRIASNWLLNSIERNAILEK